MVFVDSVGKITTSSQFSSVNLYKWNVKEYYYFDQRFHIIDIVQGHGIDHMVEQCYAASVGQDKGFSPNVIIDFFLILGVL